MNDPHVLVIGSACLDMKGRPLHPLQRGTSIPGTIRSNVGGVARNIAENLSRLGVPSTLIAAIGDDRPGNRILAQATEAGIDTSHVLVVPGINTGAYMALLDENGILAFALDDTRVTAAIEPRYIYRNRRLFRNTAMVVLDTSLPRPALKTVFRLAKQYGVPICADPASVVLAPRLRPYLPDLLLIAPNVREAQVLCNCTIAEGNQDAALMASKSLVAQGVQIAVITMAEQGLCYATSTESGHVPAVRTEIADLTGAGDALTAALIFALLNDIPISEAMRLGCSAASLTIACHQTVVPDLTLESLYNNLSV